MKKKVLLGLLLVFSIVTITGCNASKNEEKGNNDNTDKSGYKYYTCVDEDELTDGGKKITKLVVVLNKDNYIVEHQIINDDTFKTIEMYESTKTTRENNVKEHNEKYSDQYKWTLENDDATLHSVSTRIYDMSGIRDSQGKKYDEVYLHFNEDGTYDAEGWMNYFSKDKIEGGYTCSANQ